MSTDFESKKLSIEMSCGMSSGRPIVIGLYGLPASGKTYLIEEFKKRWREDFFLFYEGSEMIEQVALGGLDAFKSFDMRTQALFMLWSGSEGATVPVYTLADLSTFTYVIYLDTPVELLVARRSHDKLRKDRPLIDVAQLDGWQKEEAEQMRSLCYANGILFIQVHNDPSKLVDTVSGLIMGYCSHSETGNIMPAMKKLEQALGPDHQEESDTVVVLDADKTLAAEDTGKLFWERISTRKDALQNLFGSTMGYSYKAFYQAALLHEEIRNQHNLDSLYRAVASCVALYPEFALFLEKIAAQKRVRAVVVTCGLRRVWEKVLQQVGLSQTMKVIGAGPVTDQDSCIVPAGAKAAIVTALQNIHGKFVWAFGDNIMDLEMLRKANKAVVVVGTMSSRSHGMEAALDAAIDNKGLRASQILLPADSVPRLKPSKLPVIEFPHLEILHRSNGRLEVFDATKRAAAKVLATPTRNASIAGPMLNKAHHQIGRYLAVEFLGCSKRPTPPSSL